MENLSFHITDITANSLRAGASVLELDVRETSDEIWIRIGDNGCGMDEDTLSRATDPFYTSRTTRKVGLGLPFLIQNAEQTGGRVTIRSKPGEGTVVEAFFRPDHIDCPPWGDLPETVALLIAGNPDVQIRFVYCKGDVSFSLSTAELREALDGMPLSHPKVVAWLREMIRENLSGTTEG